MWVGTYRLALANQSVVVQGTAAHRMSIVDALERINIPTFLRYRRGMHFSGRCKDSGRDPRRCGAELSVICILQNHRQRHQSAFTFLRIQHPREHGYLVVIGAPHVAVYWSTQWCLGLVKSDWAPLPIAWPSAALAKRDANFVSIPESDFDLESPLGLLAMLEKRLEERQHAVIVVAEGVDKKFLKAEGTHESCKSQVLEI